MRKLSESPYASAAPQLFADYPADTSIGATVRRGDARRRLQQMQVVEETVRRQESLNATIADRIARLQAEHELNMDYFMRFGVTAAARQAFQEVLDEVALHGALGLRAAADLAHARALSSTGQELSG